MSRNGLRARPDRYAITGAADLTDHNEDSYDWRPYAVSRSVHLALHRRFRSPAAWSAVVARYAVTGEEWFARLSLAPVDRAAALRSRHGDGIADLFGRAAQAMPAFAAFLTKPEGT